MLGNGLCTKHQAQRQREVDQYRESSNARGYTSKWRVARALFLRQNPLCRAHQQRGELAAATEVDHIVPHRGDMKLFWNRKNWQSLCATCHSAKTASEDGGFGNRHHHGEGGSNP